MPSVADAGGRARGASRGARRAPAAVAAELRDGRRRRRARALARGDRCAPSSPASTPRPRASIRCRRSSSGMSLSVEPGTSALTSRSRIATPARPRSCRLRRRAAATEALARGSRRRRRSARTSSTTSTCSPTTASRSHGVAHDTLLQSYVLESHQPHDMDSLALRHLDVEDDQLRGRRRQGRIADRLRPGRGRARPTEYSAEDADITLQTASALLSADRRRRRSSTSSITTSKCRRARCSSAWSATAC